ncbi:MAG: hypothetical protein WKF73_17175 [Nocardioidaceae bacterium]
MVGSVIRPLRKFSNNNLNREVRWDRQGATPERILPREDRARPRCPTSATSSTTACAAHGDTARHDADVWGKRPDEAPERRQPARRPRQRLTPT